MNRRCFFSVLGASLAAAGLGGGFLWRLLKKTVRAPRVCRWKAEAVGDWVDYKNWDGGQVPGRGDDVIISSGCCTFSGKCRIGTLTLGSDANIDARPAEVAKIQCGSLRIEDFGTAPALLSFCKLRGSGTIR